MAEEHDSWIKGIGVNVAGALGSASSTPAASATDAGSASGTAPAAGKDTEVSDAGAAATVDASKVTITYGDDADSSTVASSAETAIKEIVAAAGLTSCTITSTARTPEAQAAAMYTNLENKGVDSQKELYADAGDKVIDVYVASKAAKKSEADIKADMVAKINEVGPSNVSKHCADSSKLCVVDIAPSSIADKDKFIAAVNADKRVTKFLQPPNDPAYHLEIPV
jgi:hypothetical protein